MTRVSVLNGVVSGSGAFKLRADASLNQAAPVQNTWYTILNTTSNVIIYGIRIKVATTGEDLELRVTIDGKTMTGGISAPADTNEYAAHSHDSADNLTLNTTNAFQNRSFLMYGKSVKVEMRKTTAVGAGNLQGLVKYGTS